MPEIYLITVFQKMQPIGNYLDLGEKHCVGWFWDKEEAVNAVKNNFSDMNDNTYKYAVIEKMMSGIKVPETSRAFFEWKNNSYQPIDTPKSVEHLSNFGIG